MTMSVIGLSIDCADPVLLAGFWSEVLGRPVNPGADAENATIDAAGPASGPRLAFHKVPESKTVKNRLHLDLLTDQFEGESKRLTRLGARPLWDIEKPTARWTTFADPEGNEFDLVAAQPPRCRSPHPPARYRREGRRPMPSGSRPRSPPCLAAGPGSQRRLAPDRYPARWQNGYGDEGTAHPFGLIFLDFSERRRDCRGHAWWHGRPGGLIRTARPAGEIGPSAGTLRSSPGREQAGRWS
jgi:hypothetical protein